MGKLHRLGFIGAGNMGNAILQGVLYKNLIVPSYIMVSDINEDKLKSLSKDYGIRITLDNRELVKWCDIIILSVKPNVCGEVLAEIKDSLKDDQVLVSIVAGWSTTALKAAVGEKVKILRVMPNTPALVGEGMTVFSKNHNLNEANLTFVQEIFKSLGRVETVQDYLMDAVTALSGSGPAYVFMFIEALADAGVLQGLPRDISYRLAAQTVLGSAKMVLETGKHPGELKDAVCSPGGTTIEAVFALEEKGFRSAVMEAVKRSTDKSRKLSEQM